MKKQIYIRYYDYFYAQIMLYVVPEHDYPGTVVIRSEDGERVLAPIKHVTHQLNKNRKEGLI